MLQAELARVRAGVAMEAMDVTRYLLDPPPPERKNDVGAWRRALDNAHSQLEHQYNRRATILLGRTLKHVNIVSTACPWVYRGADDSSVWRRCSALVTACDLIVMRCRLMNLEVLLKYGPTAWKVHNASLEAHNSRCVPNDAAHARPGSTNAPADSSMGLLA